MAAVQLYEKQYAMRKRTVARLPCGLEICVKPDVSCVCFEHEGSRSVVDFVGLKSHMVRAERERVLEELRAANDGADPAYVALGGTASKLSKEPRMFGGGMKWQSRFLIMDGPDFAYHKSEPSSGAAKPRGTFCFRYGSWVRSIDASSPLRKDAFEVMTEFVGGGGGGESHGSVGKDNAIAIHVPTAPCSYDAADATKSTAAKFRLRKRTFYFQFASPDRRSVWLEGIKHNLLLWRASGGELEFMISQLMMAVHAMSADVSPDDLQAAVEACLERELPLFTPQPLPLSDHPPPPSAPSADRPPPSADSPPPPPYSET